jgi:hypothetical protein
MLRRIFGLNRDEMKGSLRKLHNEELENLILFTKYNQNDKVKDKMARAYRINGGERNVYQILLGYP